MRYLIDGYNLLHAIGLLCGKAGPNGLEKARLALLSRLGGDHGADAVAVTVVFDASGAPPGAAAEDQYRGIHIYYALDGSADDLIETLIQRDAAPRQLTIVSDDHRLQQAARRRRCPVLGCLDYLEEMQRRRQRKPSASESAVKPEGVSDEEMQVWLREFADLANDPKWREALNPGFHEED
ncbi:MAG TPA: NYN domain-containing protein [Gemmataceae bacterium]|nr:NYN domain-containing protein [Gemmataceae bacterium]